MAEDGDALIEGVERMYSEPVNGVRVMKPAQVVTSQFTRQQLETGQLDPVQLTIIQK
jgi:hypothetical protein